MHEQYNIPFINQEDFEHHVSETIRSYNKSLHPVNLSKFNANIIDPIKLTFDKKILRKSMEEIIGMEIARQHDKSNNNAIGYFHQYMFKYIDNCVVPDYGFDIIYQRKTGQQVFVEMKNKHNTMNSSSGQKTFIEMQNQILKCPEDECYLVEVIAPVSRNIIWKCSINGVTVCDKRIRRVSIDKFYEIVTGLPDAFYRICKQLPITIDKLINNDSIKIDDGDTVIIELRKKNPDLLKAIYLLAFETYCGFDQLNG